jgi:replicative DNA helicase
VQDFNRKLPPQSIESEMALLGAAFIDAGAIDTIHATMQVDDLYRESHRHILRAMSTLSDKSEPIDLITMTGILKDRGQLEEVGGGAYLFTLSDFVPMAENVAHYCRIVVEKATERRLITQAQDAIALAYKGGSLDEAAAKLEAALQPSTKGSHPVHMVQSTAEAVRRIEERHESKGEITGLSYGIDDLDRATLGMHGGELIIIAGRPSMGKSALAGNILKTNGVNGKAGMMFTLEMSRLDVVDRICAGFGIKYQNIRSGRLEEMEWVRLNKTMGKLYGWTLPIDDTPGVSLREIRAKARRQKRQGLDLLVIDYLQLMSLSDPKMPRVQGIGEISRGLKQLARELDIPVVLLSQLNRSVDSRQDKRPMMSDLRESGEIEQDADVILFPYRPAAYCDKCKDRIEDGEHSFKEHQAKAEIIIEKQRAGERNLSIPAVWFGEHQRFEGVYNPDKCPY